MTRQKILSRHYSNGFAAYIYPCRGIAAQVEICVRSGSIHEEELLGCGISHYIEHMLFQGCKGYPDRTVSSIVSSLGGNMNAYTSFDRTDYHIYLPAKHIEKAVDILINMVRFPEFPENTCKSEKEVIARECDLANDKPGTVTLLNLISELYRIHPVRVPVIGCKEQLLGVTRETLTAYHAKRYTPARSFMVVTGNVDAERVFDLIEEKICDWKNSNVAEPILPVDPGQLWKREREFFFADNLSRLVIGTRPDTPAKQTAAHSILWGALGMGCAGILPVKFTVDDPLALDLRIIDYTLPGGGLSAVSAVAKDKDIQKLRSGILRELEKVAKNGISRSAVMQEKTQQYADRLRRANDIEAVSADIVDCVIVNGTPDFENSMYKKLNEVTVDDIMETARRELADERFAIVVQHGKKQSHKISLSSAGSIKCDVSATENSAELLTLTDKSVPQISVALVMPAGPVFDPAGKTGLSSLAVRMLSTGTEKYSESKLLTLLDRCGADLYTGCHANSAICQLTVPRRHFAKAFEIFTEQLMHSSFDGEIFLRERERVIDVIKHKMVTPASAAMMRAMELLMNSHPSATGKDGSLETLRTTTADAAREQWFRMLNPSTLKIGFAGDITPKEAENFAASLLKEYPAKSESLSMTAPPQFTKEELTDKIPLEREQSAAVLSFAGISAVTRKEQLAGAILRQLENGLSSKLFERVREDNSLAYSVGLGLRSGLQPGAITFHASTAKGKAEKVFALFREELERLKSRRISLEEFEKAREQAAFNACSNLNNPNYLLPEMLLDLYYKNPVLTEAEQIEDEYIKFSLDDFYDVFDAPFRNAVTVSVEAGNI